MLVSEETLDDIHCKK